MEKPPNDPWSNARIERLVQFDEALRLGRDPALDVEPGDADVDQTQQFLRQLQSVWKRAPKKIGRYALIKNLGQGAIGPCYLVEDPGTQQSLVLKVLWPDLSALAEARRLVTEEAKALRHFRHVSVASVRDAYTAGAFCYVVSEYSPGPSLAQWRRGRPQPLPWDIAVLFVARLADILEAAHRHGIVHGNLKPSNLFLPPEIEITPHNLHEAALCVADFGLAKAIQQLRLPAHTGLAWPMPQYLAPEQLSHRRQAREPANDLYGMGVLLFELLTGRSPISGTTREEVMANTRETPPPHPRQYRDEIPPLLDALVMQCLHKDPRSRPASASHLADSLRGLVTGALKGSQPSWWKNWLGWM